jgi:hypothetical protein
LRDRTQAYGSGVVERSADDAVCGFAHGGI